MPGVSPPSFPSKIVEYCGLGLPVIVAVEPSSDAGALARALRRLQAELSDEVLVERAQRGRSDGVSPDAPLPDGEMHRLYSCSPDTTAPAPLDEGAA